MPDCAAFLRAINVGGRRISNADLGSRFEDLGLGEVSVFRASGNVVFATEGQPVARLTARIEAGLEAALGYEVVTFLRTADEVRELAELTPFDAALVEASTGKLHVAFLSSPPSAGARKEVLGLATDEDRLAFGERELFWLPSGGMSDSELDLKAIEKLLGPMTLRTKGTVERIAAKYFAD